MRFPICHCLPTSLLTRESYNKLVRRVVSEGHVNMIDHLDYTLVTAWDYLGIGIYNDLNVWSHPHSFMEPNTWINFRNVKDEDFPNVLTEQWLEEYLK